MSPKTLYTLFRGRTSSDPKMFSMPRAFLFGPSLLLSFILADNSANPAISFAIDAFQLHTGFNSLYKCVLYDVLPLTLLFIFPLNSFAET